MAAVLAHSRTNKPFGLRPMDPIRDLRAVANLIEEAFADELDRSGQSALRELHWLSYLGPVLWWMVHFSPDHSDFLSGFVWEEDNKVVGNITINRTSPGSRRWLISNLAVARTYRSRGIARGLMGAAVELAREYQGASVSLQVKAGNLPAKNLYDSMNFKEVMGTTYMHLRRVPRKPALSIPPLPQELTLRRRHASSADDRQAYDLACAATPPSTQKELPLRPGQFQLSDVEWIKGFFRQLTGSGPAAFWVVEDKRRFVGLMSILPGTFGDPHRLDLTIHPDRRGELEKPLISRALHYLSSWRNRSIVVKHPAEHEEAIQAYRDFGFQEDRTLIWMKLDL